MWALHTAPSDFGKSMHPSAASIGDNSWRSNPCSEYTQGKKVSQLSGNPRVSYMSYYKKMSQPVVDIQNIKIFVYVSHMLHVWYI